MTSPIRWHHASLTVAELDPAIAFFEAVFGFEPLFIERGMREDIEVPTGRTGLHLRLHADAGAGFSAAARTDRLPCR